METLQAIGTRKSIRRFIDREIPLDIIRRVVEAGTQAPSGGNRQPWRFVVVTDRDKMAKFDPYFHQSWVEHAPAIIVACADPHDTWGKYDEDDDCWILDTAAAIENMLLAIHDLGLGAVWVLSCSKRDIRKLVGIPPHWQIISIIPFGYYRAEDVAEFGDLRIENSAPKPRRPLSEVAFLNGVDNPIGTAT